MLHAFRAFSDGDTYFAMSGVKPVDKMVSFFDSLVVSDTD